MHAADAHWTRIAAAKLVLELVPTTSMLVLRAHAADGPNTVVVVISLICLQTQPNLPNSQERASFKGLSVLVKDCVAGIKYNSTLPLQSSGSHRSKKNRFQVTFSSSSEVAEFSAILASSGVTTRSVHEVQQSLTELADTQFVDSQPETNIASGNSKHHTSLAGNVTMDAHEHPSATSTIPNTEPVANCGLTENEKLGAGRGMSGKEVVRDGEDTSADQSRQSENAEKAALRRALNDPAFGSFLPNRRQQRDMLAGPLVSLFGFCTAMFLGAFVAGSIPLAFTFSESRLALVSTFGSGLLLGTAFSGVETLYAAAQAASPAPTYPHRNHEHKAADAVDVKAEAPEDYNSQQNENIDEKNGSLDKRHVDNIEELDVAAQKPAPHTDNHFEPNKYIGPSLVLGFMLMLLVDQIPGGGHGHSHNASDSRKNLPTGGLPHHHGHVHSAVEEKEELTGNQGGINPSGDSGPILQTSSATIGLIVHAAADGIALGAALSSGEGNLGFVVFLAIILHKAPSAFGLTTHLLKTMSPSRGGISTRARIRSQLFLFSIAAPVGTILTFGLIGQLGYGESTSITIYTGIALLFSAGTFLYAATVHVLPEIYLENGKLTSSQIGVLLLGSLLPYFLQFGTEGQESAHEARIALERHTRDTDGEVDADKSRGKLRPKFKAFRFAMSCSPRPLAASETAAPALPEDYAARMLARVCSSASPARRVSLKQAPDPVAAELLMRLRRHQRAAAADLHQRHADEAKGREMHSRVLLASLSIHKHKERVGATIPTHLVNTLKFKNLLRSMEAVIREKDDQFKVQKFAIQSDYISAIGEIAANRHDVWGNLLSKVKKELPH
ncbi:hypothetical protein HDU82_006265 [Entophlyctis luteolus]|nr:hypothetical protein HDU82_006265 [Entophlyctis luteolus]